MSLEILNVLVLSTAHLQKETMKIVSDDDTISSDMYSCTIWTDYPNSFPELVKAQSFAKQWNCAYIKFDEDGPTIPDLDSFDW